MTALDTAHLKLTRTISEMRSPNILSGANNTIRTKADFQASIADFSKEAVMDLRESAQKYLDAARTQQKEAWIWQRIMIAATVIYALTFIASYIWPRH